MKPSSLLLGIGLLATAACSYTTETPPAQGATLRIANGAVGSGVSGVVLLVDGAISGAAVWGASSTVTVPAGTHTIEVRRAVNGSPGTQKTITVAAGDQLLVVAVEPLGGGTEPLIYGDTNAVVPAGATKLRVIHAAALAPAITVRRTQPDFDSLITVQFPFPYGAASPYILSTPGTWTVVVSHENQTDTLVATGSITIPDGHVRTVLLIDDGLGGVAARVLDP